MSEEKESKRIISKHEYFKRVEHELRANLLKHSNDLDFKTEIEWISGFFRMISVCMDFWKTKQDATLDQMLIINSDKKLKDLLQRKMEECVEFGDVEGVNEWYDWIIKQHREMTQWVFCQIKAEKKKIATQRRVDYKQE